MSKHLVIVESPAKCKKIEKILGSDYKCVATYGHIFELSSLEQIDFQKYEQNKYKTIKSKKDKIKSLSEHICKTRQNNRDIIIASDNDREGEGIAYHLCLNYNLPVKSTKRIIFNEITEKAIQCAISNPSKIDLNMVHSQQTRQILDLCLGFKVSPLLWKNVYYGLSAGRCQTPALQMIRDCELEIEKYCESPHFEWSGYGIFGDKQWNFKLVFSEKQDKDSIEHYMNACKNHDFYLSREDCSKLDKRYPPLPFMTSTLQQYCFKSFGFSSKSTMKYAQDLYESGLITYMRTDSTKISKDFAVNIINYIKDTYGKHYVSSSPYSRCENKKKENSQGAHECIRVTNIHTKNIDINKNFSIQHQRIYMAIWKHTIQCLMKESQYEKYILSIDAPDNNIYVRNIYKCRFIGYEIVNESEICTMDYDYMRLILPNQDTQMPVKHHYTICENTVKNIPKLLNESMLIKKLESYNIGRPSTYASIIQSLESKYISVEQNQKIGCFDYIQMKLNGDEITHEETKKEVYESKKFKVNDKGINALQYLSHHFKSIFDYDFTTNMESELDNIARGEQTKYSVCSKFNSMLDDVIKHCSNTESEYKIKNNSTKINLGKHENNAVYLCKGKFGYYLEHKKEKYSIPETILPKSETIDTLDFTIDKAIQHIHEKKAEKNSQILRNIDNDSSVRQSAHGHYIFYKNSKMKQPKFINMKNLENVDYMTCDIDILKQYIIQEKDQKKPKYSKYKKYKK